MLRNGGVAAARQTQHFTGKEQHFVFNLHFFFFNFLKLFFLPENNLKKQELELLYVSSIIVFGSIT